MGTYSVHSDIWGLIKAIWKDDVVGVGEAEELASVLEKSIVSPRSSEFQASASNCLTEIAEQLAKDHKNIADLQRSFAAAKTANSDLANRFVHLLSALISEPELKQLLTSSDTGPKMDMKVTKSRSSDISLGKKQLEKVLNPEIVASVNTMRQRNIELGDFSSLAKAFEWKSQRKTSYRTEILKENNTPFDNSLASMTQANREAALIGDLMLCFEGFQGQHIRAVDRKGDGNVEFEVNPAFPPPLREIAFRCLPVASAFHRIQNFIEKRSHVKFGFISQALCGGMSVILQEYRTLLAEFMRNNKESIVVGKLSCQIDPLLVSMRILAEICEAIEKNGFVGGRILTFLHEKQWSYSGVARGKQLCFFLTQAASKPFFDKMLPRWLFHGKVVDPCREFMIMDTGDPSKRMMSDSDADFDETDSWQKRYVLKTELCPSFLKPVSEDILKCGKNLNILASCCECESNFGEAPELKYSEDSKDYLFLIERACARANKALLDFLVVQHELVLRFKSMKRFFLVERGDWLLQFLVNANTDLMKPADYTRTDRLQTTMDEAISLAISGYDPLKENIRAEVDDHSLMSFLNYVISISVAGVEDVSFGYRERMMIESDRDLKGIEGFCLDWEPEWPLSLVFNPKSQLQYKILFRRILTCKNVERMLCKSWTDGKKGTVACLIRQKMLAFVQNYMFYCTQEIIESNWIKFQAEVKTASSIDDVMKAHGSFLDTCTKDCMLTDRALVEIIEELLKLNLHFALSPTMNLERVNKKFHSWLESLFENVRRLDNQHKVWNNFLFRLAVMTKGNDL